jgi:hypothetical protein
MKSTENEETDTKVLYAPTQFYDACDECDTLPEERWEEFRQKLDEEKKTIMEGRQRVIFLVLFYSVKCFLLVFLGFKHF